MKKREKHPQPAQDFYFPIERVVEIFIQYGKQQNQRTSKHAGIIQQMREQRCVRGREEREKI
ncbi:hypothetical protein BS642_03510 [Chromobacterium violaceum]|nr:hypothetical protein BS642_03510 [Chromobacterium violaceum]